MREREREKERERKRIFHARFVLANGISGTFREDSGYSLLRKFSFSVFFSFLDCVGVDVYVLWCGQATFCEREKKKRKRKRERNHHLSSSSEILIIIKREIR
jgi:hypothetical protein